MDNLYNYLSNSSILRTNGIIIKLYEYDFKQIQIILPENSVSYSLTIIPTRWYGFEISLSNQDGHIVYNDDLGYTDFRCFDTEDDIEDEILRLTYINKF
jgi:hypothetical protein